MLSINAYNPEAEAEKVCAKASGRINSAIAGNFGHLGKRITGIVGSSDLRLIRCLAEPCRANQMSARPK